MTLEFWFDFSCPYAYLASRKAAAWAAAGVEIEWRPMLLGGVFRGIASGPNGNGPMAALGPAKARHNLLDMHRWAEVLEAPFQMPAAHPMRTVRALRVLLALPRREWPAAIAALYAAYWARAEDITRDDVISAALIGAGIDIGDAFSRADSEAIKDDLRARTDEAIALGIFGAPAWVVRRVQPPHTLVWGQDRLPWVEAMLAGWDPDRDAVPPGGHRSAGTTLTTAPPASTLDVYFDVSSPFGYLALTQLPSIAAATGVTPRLIPILLGGLFKDIGQAVAPLLAMPAPKQRYFYLETARWARWWGAPFDFPKKFPQRTIMAQRLGVIAAERPFADQCRLATALARGMWAEQRDLEDPETLRAILVAEGFPSDWIERTNEPAIKATLIENSATAKAMNAFGVPTLVVNGRFLFWGQDRLDLVGRALAGWIPRTETV
ncbi:MAG TPA: 2-hydroxychromene-2-carboxylate isomerase [Kofleriaceae bacterium]